MLLDYSIHCLLYRRHRFSTSSMNPSKSKKHSRLTRPKARVLTKEEIEYRARLEERIEKLEERIKELESPVNPEYYRDGIPE